MARLPQLGADDGAWGAILNDFLSQSLNPDGTVKDTGLVGSKSDDSTVVHNAGDETIAGIKTFSASPIIPTPTTNTQAANKIYVDNFVTSGIPDATTSSKGIVQLVGDLSGTAALPTVPALATKVSASRLVSTGSGLSGGGDLSVDRTFSIDPAIVATLSGAQTLTNKTLTNPVINTPTGITKSDVGLSNVDNTSDVNKPVSTATQLALNLKADDSTVIHNTGAETIAGVKTFSSTPVVPDSSFSASKLSFDVATQAELDTHVNDISAAHAASAIGFTPTGTVVSTNVQAAIAEVAGATAGANDLGIVNYTDLNTARPSGYAGILWRGPLGAGDTLPTNFQATTDIHVEYN